MKKRKKDETENETKKGIAESFLEGISGFGGFFRELGKTEVFQKRFKEVNERIEENLRKGEKRYVSVDGNISVRPLAIRPSSQRIISEIKKEAPEAEFEIKKDYAYGKKGDKLLLAIRVPKEDVEVTLTGRNVLVKGDNFRKKIELSAYYKNIAKKQYKKGILMLELGK